MNRRKVRVYSWWAKLCAVSMAAWLAVMCPLIVEAQVVLIPASSGVATSVSAAAFPLLAPNGTGANPSFSFSLATGTGLSNTGGQLVSSAGGAARLSIANAGPTLRSDGAILWSTTTDPTTGTNDTGLARPAAGVIKATNGSSGTGWIQNTEGDQFLTANATNATITPANLTDLTTNVTNARKYVFTFVAQVDNSTDADGIRFDFDGGTATATDFRVTCKSFNNNLTTNVAQTTALATDITEATYTGAGSFECSGSFEPSSTGTFIPRFAMNTAASGTLTVFRGSYLLVNDMP